LRSIILEKATIVERTQFVSMNLYDEDAVSSLVEQETISWRVPEVEPCHTEHFQSAWAVSWLPEGFASVGNRVTMKGEQVLMFSDGLVSISVFIGSQRYENLPKITARRGATSAVMSPLLPDRSKTVAVVGEVPIATARKIAVSVTSR
jgi:sigma-E factor negative regulatory protein RseB